MPESAVEARGGRSSSGEVASGRATAGGWTHLAPLDGLGPLPPAFWIVAGLGVLLRLIWLTQEGYWADEVYGYFDSLKPLSNRLRTVHPAHFLLGRLFLDVWDSVGAIRLMQLCWAAATFPIWHDLVRRVLGPSAAIIATIFLAASAYHVNYSIDANYYGAVIFWATAGSWLAVRYVQNRHPVDGLAAAVSPAIGFLFHPFGGVQLVSLSTVLFALGVLDKRHRDLLWPPTWWRARREGAAILIGVIEIAVVLAVAIFFVPRAGRLARLLFEWLELGATPRNYRFFPNLVYEYFRGNLSDYPLSSRLPLSMAWPATVLAALGAVVAIRRCPWIAAVLGIPIIASFVLIVNLKAQHHFYIRYFSYNFPSLVLFVIWGAVQLVGWRVDDNSPAGSGTAKDSRAAPPDADAFLPLRFRFAPWIPLAVYAIGIGVDQVFGWTPRTPGMVIAWVLGFVVFLSPWIVRLKSSNVLLAGIVGVFVLLNVLCVVNRFLVRGGSSWHTAAEYLKTHARPGELVVYEYPQEGEMLRYYLPRIGLSFRDTLKVPEGEGPRGSRLAQVQGLARTRGPFWLVRTWNINTQRVLDRWAEAHLDCVVDAPSNFEPFLDVKLYRADVAGRYLQGPYGLRVNFRDDERVAGSDSSAAGWERIVDVDGATTVAAVVSWPGGSAASGMTARYRSLVDGVALPWAEPGGEPVAVRLPEGTHRLGIEIEGGALTAPSPSVLWSALGLAQGATIPAVQVSLPFPSFCTVDEYRGREALRLSRSLGVQYWIDFPTSGTYELTIEGVHDKPRGPILSVALGGEYQGFVIYDALNNEWGKRLLPLSVAGAGFRSIAVNLVNAGIGQWGLPADEDLNAILGDIHLRKLAAGESPVDERLIVGPSLSNQPATVPIPLKDQSGDLLKGWTVVGEFESIELAADDPIGLDTHEAVEVSVPFNSEGVMLLSPPRPIPAATPMVCAEALISTWDMVNHSVTLGLVLVGADGTTPLAQETLYGQEGMTSTNRNVRFSVASPILPEAHAYAVAINIYPNGARPSVRSGVVRFGSVAVAEYP